MFFQGVENIIIIVLCFECQEKDSDVFSCFYVVCLLLNEKVGTHCDLKCFLNKIQDVFSCDI